LYQRGIYPDDEFLPVKKYNMTIMITKDGGLREYLSQVLQQINSTRGANLRQYITSLLLLVVARRKVCSNLTKRLRSSTDWLGSGDIQKLVVVIADQKTKETKERWTFDIQLDKEAAATFAQPTNAALVLSVCEC
jgi:mitotic spindle assembly checkpoint protein MAD2